MQQSINRKKEKFKLSSKLQEKVFNIRLQTSNHVRKKKSNYASLDFIFIIFFRKLIYQTPQISLDLLSKNTLANI